MAFRWRARVVALALVGLLANGCTFITRVSVDTAGGDPNGFSAQTSINADGRYVVFSSIASDVVAGGSCGVVARDLREHTNSCVSVNMAGDNVQGNEPSISGDGRYVAFASDATDLVPGDENQVTDVFVRDRQAGTTSRVSVDAGGRDPDERSSGPSVSGDGRYVAFTSSASDLVVGDGNAAEDVYLRDLQTNTTARVSLDMNGGDPLGSSGDPSVSADGRYVAFTSVAGDLVPGDGNSIDDVYVRDVQTNTNTRVSIDTGGTNTNGISAFPAISGNARYVAFHSHATDLVAGDGNSRADIFVRDLQTNTTTRASVDTAGGDSDGLSLGSTISGDGRYVGFGSAATDLVNGDGNDTFDAFVRDRQTETTTRVSVNLLGFEANGASAGFGTNGPVLSADGRYVGFESEAPNLVNGDGTSGIFGPDVFVRAVVTPTVESVTPSEVREATAQR